VFGDGEQTRSFTYVDDAVRATLLAAERPEAIGEAINVGSGVEISIQEVARRVIAITESGSTLAYLPYESVYGANFEDTRRRVPDVSKARTHLGFECAVDLDTGITRTAQWWDHQE
jgi:UDP-glucose 4-epimerase